MTRPFVIDADAFKQIFDDIVSNDNGIGRKSIDLILKSDHILIDSGGKIKQQWRDCTCGERDEFFAMWVSQRLVDDQIREVPYSSDASLRSKLDALGVPRNDRVYIYVAVSNRAYCIISEDSDLYDPAAKLWNAAKKRKLREGGKAPVAKFMLKKHNVHIFPLCMTEAHCLEQCDGDE